MSKVSILLGNGFDINMGLKTSYGDFYNYYLDIKSDDNDIIELKHNITDSVKKPIWNLWDGDKSCNLRDRKTWNI